MNKELIELQKGCCATCVVVPENQYRELGQMIIMEAGISDEYLFAQPTGYPIFKEKLDNLSNNGHLTYFVIKGIAELSEEMQNRYISLIKDREFCGYKLPSNVIVTFTVKNRDNLKNISKELSHFCVVAF